MKSCDKYGWELDPFSGPKISIKTEAISVIGTFNLIYLPYFEGKPFFNRVTT